MRYIEIDSCEDCPSKAHKGAFGHVAYIPICRANDKELPHTVNTNEKGGVFARYTGEIPEWCSLPKLQKEKYDYK